MTDLSITLITDAETFFLLDEILAASIKSISAFEEDSNSTQWKVHIVVSKENLSIIKKELDIYKSRIKNIIIDDINTGTNWLEKTYKHFPPINIGSFYIHGSHTKRKISESQQYSLCIDAATAFGSGEHPTTESCLLTMEKVKEKDFCNIIDMGCGSGILAFAAKLLWPNAKIGACDCDQEAVHVANKYAKINKSDVFTFLSNGFDADFFKNKKFDLIIANILANPLISLAKGMRAHIEAGGYIILSGILESQIDTVSRAYEKEGFSLINKRIIKNWACLSFQVLKGS